jgi:hypothetical protein
VRNFLEVLDYAFVVVLELREMEWLWQGHVLLLLIRDDAEGNKYCRDRVTARFCCSTEKKVTLLLWARRFEEDMILLHISALRNGPFCRMGLYSGCCGGHL